MRTAAVCLTLVAGVVAGSVFSVMKNPQARAAPVQPADQGASLVGQRVEVNFRGADNISAPYPHDGQPHLSGKLESIKGTVVAATAAWVELKTDSGAEFAHAWIPVSSIAYISNGDTPKGGPATQP